MTTLSNLFLHRDMQNHLQSDHNKYNRMVLPTNSATWQKNNRRNIAINRNSNVLTGSYTDAPKNIIHSHVNSPKTRCS